MTHVQIWSEGIGNVAVNLAPDFLNPTVSIAFVRYEDSECRLSLRKDWRRAAAEVDGRSADDRVRISMAGALSRTPSQLNAPICTDRAGLGCVHWFGSDCL